MNTETKNNDDSMEPFIEDDEKLTPGLHLTEEEIDELLEQVGDIIVQ